MMARKIIIKSCEECPHLGHMGGFSQIAYVPRCEKIYKELPHTVSAQNGRCVATKKEGIPDWCPLEKNND